MSSILRAFARLHQRQRAKRPGPLGPGMAVFVGDHVSNKIVLDGAFALSELNALDQFVLGDVPAGSICLDIGGNIGNHARFFAGRFDHVFSFEPHPASSLLLRANALGHNITALDYGLSDRGATLPAISNARNIGASRVATDAAEADTTFEVKRLDDVIGGLSEAAIGFVKIDVEGHEAQVIAGAAQTLAAHDASVAIEVNPEAVRDGTTDAVEALREIGYSHFYGLVNRAGWTGISPKPLRTIVRSLLRLFAPSKIYRMDFALVEKLDPAGYPLLVASKRPLKSKA